MGAALGAGPMWGAKRGVCPRATWGGTLENGGAPPIAVGRQLGDDRLEGLFENLRFQRLLAQEPMKFANLILQSPIIEAGTTSSPLPAAVRLPCATSRRQVNNWFGATPCRRATRLTVIPGSKVSSTMRTFSGAVQRRRR